MRRYLVLMTVEDPSPTCEMWNEGEIGQMLQGAMNKDLEDWYGLKLAVVNVLELKP